MTELAQTTRAIWSLPNAIWGGAFAPNWAKLKTQMAGWWRDGNVPWLRDISIQARFTLLIGVVAVAALQVGLAYGVGAHLVNSALNDQAQFQRLWEQSNNIRAGALAMQTAANGLTAERRHKFIEDFDAEFQRVGSALTVIRATPAAAVHGAEIDRLDQSVGEVAAQFKALAAVTVELGLGDSDGLRGRLSASVKAIEDELKMWPNTDDLKTRALRMREAEKDFLLYQDRSYLGKNRKQAMEFDLGIDSAGIADSTKENFRTLLTSYSTDMAAFGKATLDQQDKVVKLRAQFAALQPQIQAFAAMANDGMAEAARRQDNTRANVGLLMAGVGIFALLTVVLVGLVSGRSIARPVLMMEVAMSRLADGDLAVEIPGLHRADEVGLMAKAVPFYVAELGLDVDVCGFCQSGVSCASMIPAKKARMAATSLE